MRLRSQEGFGLIELLMAMVMLNIGILAIVAAFNSGAVTLNRASRISTAAALADQQMELYRAIPYASIALDASTIPATSPLYDGLGLQRDAAHDDLRGADCQRVQCQPLDRRDEQPRPQALPGRHVHHSLDDHDQPPTPTNGRPVKIVTVVVRDGGALTARPLVRIASTFDQSTG